MKRPTVVVDRRHSVSVGKQGWSASERINGCSKQVAEERVSDASKRLELELERLAVELVRLRDRWRRIAAYPGPIVGPSLIEECEFSAQTVYAAVADELDGVVIRRLVAAVQSNETR
jgi:hypothetical protein